MTLSVWTESEIWSEYLDFIVGICWVTFQILVMGCCFAPGCSHRGTNCQLFRFPVCPTTRKKWIKLIRRSSKIATADNAETSEHSSSFSSKQSQSLGSLPSAWPSLSLGPVSRVLSGEGSGQGVMSSMEETETGELPSSSLDQHQAPESLACALPNISFRPVSRVCLEENSAQGVKLSVGETRTGELPSSLMERYSQAQGSPASTLPNLSLRPVSRVVLADSNVQDILSFGEKAMIQDCPSPMSGETAQLMESGTRDIHVITTLKEQNALLQLQIFELKNQLDTVQKELKEEKIKHLHNFAKGDIAAQAENFFLRDEVKKLKEESEKKYIFSFQQISHKDYLVSHYTGMPNELTFNALVSMFDGVDKDIKYYSKWRVTRLSVKEQLFMTLIKLRRSFSHTDLAVRFGIGETTVKNVVMTWVYALHHFLIGAENSAMSKLPSVLKNQMHLPDCFKEYKNTRIILDCTEVNTAVPELLSKHNKMYSSYKHHVTAKGLVGITPNGTVTFVSKLYPGRTSDKEIVVHSKVLEKLEAGNTVMADKGFLISSLLPMECLSIYLHLRKPLNLPKNKWNKHIRLLRLESTSKGQSEESSCFASLIIFLSIILVSVQSYSKFVPR